MGVEYLQHFHDRRRAAKQLIQGLTSGDLEFGSGNAGALAAKRLLAEQDCRPFTERYDHAEDRHWQAEIVPLKQLKLTPRFPRMVEDFELAPTGNADADTVLWLAMRNMDEAPSVTRILDIMPGLLPETGKDRRPAQVHEKFSTFMMLAKTARDDDPLSVLLYAQMIENNVEELTLEERRGLRALTASLAVQIDGNGGCYLPGKADPVFETSDVDAFFRACITGVTQDTEDFAHENLPFLKALEHMQNGGSRPSLKVAEAASLELDDRLDKFIHDAGETRLMNLIELVDDFTREPVKPRRPAPPPEAEPARRHPVSPKVPAWARDPFYF